MKPEISIIIPTIEEEGVFKLIAHMRKEFRKPEIIVVDKSSEAYRRRLAKIGVVLIRQESRGVENAVFEGLKMAHSDIIASIDGDGTHDPHSLLEGYRIIKSGKADMVMGNRLKSLHYGAMSFHQRFGNRFLSRLYRHMYGVNVHDFLVGMFVVSRKAFNSVKDIAPYRAGHAFFAIELAKKGYRIVEVPVEYYPRSEGESKLSRSKVLYGVGVASHMIRLARDYNPLLIFGSIGVILIVIGLLIGLMVFFTYLATGVMNEVGRALIAFMLVVVGFLSIISGLLIDLLLGIDRKLSDMPPSSHK